MPKSTSAKTAGKPDKPRRDFPLFPHATGRWAKKILGRQHYFGPWADPQGALDKYLAEREFLHAGRKPPGHRGGLTVRDLCNAFLRVKEQLLDNGELSPRHWRDLHASCEMLIKTFGRQHPVDDLGPEDFGALRAKLAKTLGVALGNSIQRVRSVFKFGYDEGLIEKPLRFGQSFAKPSRKTIRKEKANGGAKMFEAAEVRKMLAKAGVPLKAMVLLGINCGFGQTDVAELPTRAIDLKRGWIDFPRPKSGVPRRCPLWPETVDALRAAIKSRPDPKDEANAGLTFLTTFGRRWVRTHLDDKSKIIAVDSVLLEFKKLLKEAKVRPLGFYALRHTFRTIADGARDQVATSLIMGHHDESMAGLYRERVDDARLRNVTNHVRALLFPPARKKTKPK